MISSTALSEYEELEKAATERAEIVAKYDKGHEGAQIDPWEDPKFEVYHVTDRYGFIHEEALPKVSDSAEEKVKQLEVERTKKWLKMIKSWDKYYPGEKFSRRIYKGIPDSLRGEVWARLLTISKVKAEQEGVYVKMRTRARSKSPDIRQIDLDVNRTYRNHIMFRERYGVKQQALFHVLAAYSMYNTEVGYCQGMSEIAALLLMYLNEEDGFWALSQLFVDKRHAMHGFFIPGFLKLLRFQEHHDTVLKKFLPKVRRQLEKNDVYATLYTIKWFLQCFLDRTPFTLTLRLWDIYMLEGERLLTAMSYTILKLHRRKLMRMHVDDLLKFFQSELEKDFGYDDDTVIDQLQVCMEELRKAKMDVPPKPKKNELPTLPFGLEIEPSIEQIIGKRKIDTNLEEHFRRNPRGGKSAYLKKKAGPHAITPEMSRSRHGADNKSIQSSRLSEYSADDRSSYYDTAANSRLSIADYSSRTSAPSSRTSFGDGSEMGSLNLTMARQTPTPGGALEETGEKSHALPGFPSREDTLENLANEVNNDNKSAPSEISDYDNLFENGAVLNHNGQESPVMGHQFIPRQITVSRSDGFIPDTNSELWTELPEDKLLTETRTMSKDESGNIVSESKKTSRASASDVQTSKYVSKIDVCDTDQQNGYLIEHQSSRQISETRTTTTKKTYIKSSVQKQTVFL
ncbi:hypothetical protein ScPMuIL_012836 [Solemya velum]